MNSDRSVDVLVRAAEAHDITGLVAAYEWLFEPPGSRPPSWDAGVAGARLLDVMQATGSTMLVAERGHELVGFCTAYLDITSVRYGRRCWVEDLAVDPGHRSAGVGAAVLAQARRWAAEHGATHLELDSALTRTDAHRFYARHDPSARSLCFSWRL